MLRLNMASKFLDDAVRLAAADDSRTERVKELPSAAVFRRVNMDSGFWTLQLNQIFLARQAQFSTTNQVEVGKPAVIEEIIRTFLTVQCQKDSREAEKIRGKIEEALQ